MTTTNDEPFQTAARRRGGQTIKFPIQHWAYDDDDDETGHPVDVVLMVDPNVDMVRVGLVLGDQAEAMQGFGNAQGAELAAKLKVMDVETPKLRAGIRELLTPTSKAKWDLVSGAVDLMMLTRIVSKITNELSGLDPTQPGSSLDGSSTTGTTSTDGVEHEESTPQGSPSVDA